LYYDTDSETWIDVWVKKTFPAACKVGIHRKDFIEPMYAVAHWEAYAQKKADGTIAYAWRTMPTIMLAKCAEALALRKAFPQELSGLYTSDELSEDKIHEVSVAPESETKKEQVILKGTYYPEKPKKQKDPDKEDYINKLTSAKDLIELQSLIAEVRPEWDTDQFKAFTKTLFDKLNSQFTEEMKEILQAEEVKPEAVQKKGVKK
jgi:hypothetical protein